LILPVTLELAEPDTIILADAVVMPGEAVMIPLVISNADSITDISLPLSYDPDFLMLDSTSFAGMRIEYWMFKSLIDDPVAGTIKLFATSHAVPTPGTPLVPAIGPIANLYFTVKPGVLLGTSTAIDTISLDLSPYSCAETFGATFQPVFISGSVRTPAPPEIILTPPELYFATVRGEAGALIDHLTVENGGEIALNWSAESSSPRLILTPIEGTDGSIIECLIDPSNITSGEFVDTIWVTDQAAINSPQEALAYISIDEPDTLNIGEATVEPFGEVILPISLIHADTISAFSIPLRFDPLYVEADSASFLGRAASDWDTLLANIDMVDGMMHLSGADYNKPLLPGTSQLATLHFRTSPLVMPGMELTIDTAMTDDTELSVRLADGNIAVPRVDVGTIWIDTETGVFEQSETSSEEQTSLISYPNPFNASTIIAVRGWVEQGTQLAIYDVLGRMVRGFDGDLIQADGSLQLVWDGRDNLGHLVSSGVYFAHIRAQRASLTHKLVLMR